MDCQLTNKQKTFFAASLTFRFSSSPSWRRWRRCWRSAPAQSASNGSLHRCYYKYAYAFQCEHDQCSESRFVCEILRNFAIAPPPFMRNSSLNFLIWPSKVIPFNTKNKEHQKPKSPGSATCHMPPPAPRCAPLFHSLRDAAKKVLFLVAGPVRGGGAAKRVCH